MNALKAGEHIGPYRIVKRLGEGGIGEVYLAFDESLARDVAIKRLRPELAEREALVARFRTEAQTLARLNHPNIATLYALVDEGDATYMVMEYVEGNTVASLLRERGALTLEPALRLAFQALAGIGCAHDRGVIHRDIKGSNLMLDTNGTLKVMDFGIARVLGDERHTHAGQLIGTPEFMAPEQIRGEDADERADLYALAILLFSLFTGRAPFQARSEYDLMKAQVEAQPPSVLERCPELPRELDAVLRKALAKEARHRFQNAAEFRAALQPFANDSWSDGPLLWPTRERSKAECDLLGDADIDAATEIGDGAKAASSLPLIDAELIDAELIEPTPLPSEARTADLELPATLDTREVRRREADRRFGQLGLLARWAQGPRLIAAGFALGALLGLDLVVATPQPGADAAQQRLSNMQLGASQPQNESLGSLATARELRENLFSRNQSPLPAPLYGPAEIPGLDLEMPAVSAKSDPAKAPARAKDSARVGRSTKGTNDTTNRNARRPGGAGKQGEPGWVIRR